MTVSGRAKFAIHSYYSLPGKLCELKAGDLFANAARSCLSTSAELSTEPLVLKGVAPLVLNIKGELQIVNDKELMLFFANDSGAKLNPNQKIVVCEVDVDLEPLHISALAFICEASATKAKAAQEKMIEALSEDKDLLSEVRQILGLRMRRGLLTGIDIQRIFQLKPGTAHNRLHATLGPPKPEHLCQQSEEKHEKPVPEPFADNASEISTESYMTEYLSAVCAALPLYEPETTQQAKALSHVMDRIDQFLETGEKPIDEEQLKKYIQDTFGDAATRAIESMLQEARWL